MSLQRDLVRFALGELTRSDLIQVALDALEDGYDSKHLAILAGENPQNNNSFEVETYFRRALKELGLVLPTHDTAERTMIAHWARQIVSGSIPPREGAGRIVSIYHQTDKKNTHYAGDALDIAQLYGLYYNYDDLQGPYAVHKGRHVPIHEAVSILDRAIVAEARAYLEKNVP